MKIDGRDFKITPLRAKEAFMLKTHLAKLALPAVGGIIGSIKGGGAKGKQGGSLLDMSIDGGQLSAVISTLFSQLGEDEFFALIKRLLKGVAFVEEKSKKFLSFDDDASFDTKFDLAFNGSLTTVYKVVFEVLKENYPDFFAPIQQLGNRLQVAGWLPGKDGENELSNSSENSEN